MNSKEIRKQLKMTYLELTEYLLIKYGPSQYSYFYTIEMRSVDKRVSRSDEGLFCHHIDEDKAIMLSSIKYAKKNPIEYQMANRLVYCNFIEHLILHIKISLEPKHPQANENEVQGFGGIKLITTHLNDYFDGYEVK